MPPSIRLSAKVFVPASSAEVWRHLADTDRMNRSIGLPPVRFEPDPDGRKAKHYAAQSRLLGIGLDYAEEPFEWVEKRHYRVRRCFAQGPLIEYTGGVRLTERPGGVEVESFAEIHPRNWVGVMLARTVGKRVVEREIPRYAAALGAKGAPADIFARAQALVASWPVAADLADRLARHVSLASPVEAACLRPFELAERWNLDRMDVLRALLHAAKSGLLELRWLLFCPGCLRLGDCYARLAEVPAAARCKVCGAETSAPGSLELRFRVSPALRPDIKNTYCVGGPANFPAVLAQVSLAAGGGRVEDVDLAPGDYRVFCFQFGEAAALKVSAEGRAESVSVSCSQGRLDLDAASLKAGRAQIRFANYAARPALFVVEREDWHRRAALAEQAWTLPEFRGLFPSEVGRA